MNSSPRKLTLEEWDQRYSELSHRGFSEPWYGGLLSRHVTLGGDLRLSNLRFDNSPAALHLWNFLLTENDRLQEARGRGDKLVGTMKDLGTVPVMAYAIPGVRAFYPDGAWWTPCIMECTDGLLQRAEILGIDGSFCPVRAMLAAFESGGHFPKPDSLICSTGAVCDDFSAIAQRLQTLGFDITWWEMPRRREPEQNEAACELPGQLRVPRVQVELVAEELGRLSEVLSAIGGCALDDQMLQKGIRKANQVRHTLADLRLVGYRSPAAPLPALEMLIAEMLAIHFCSDLEEALRVLSGLLAEARRRIARGECAIPETAVRVYWVNPVADLRIMNWLEEWGGRICGSDYMFTHALDPIPEDLPPLEALARIALADPMVGPAQDRARRVVSECRACHAEAVIVSRIPGASHCAYEGSIIRSTVAAELGIPVIELEIPPLSDSMRPTIATRMQALLEAALARR